MNNCLILHSSAVSIEEYMYLATVEYVTFGKIMAIEGKYNQIGASNATLCQI